MLAGICPAACIALYCNGVMCSKPGGGTSQYNEGFLLLEWLSNHSNNVIFLFFISLLELTFMSTTSTWRSRTTSPSLPGTRSGTTPVFTRSGTSPAVSFPAAFTFLLHYTFGFFIVMYISAIQFFFLPFSSFMFTIEDHPFLCQ